jgi:predicted transcriptional regulator
MTDIAKRAAEALELLPPEMQEAAVAYLYQQGEKFRILKALVQEGIDDAEAGRVVEWNFEEFLREARKLHAKRRPAE